MKTVIFISKSNTTYFLFAFFMSLVVNAQIQKAFTPRYNESIKGDVTIIANSMISRTATNNYNGEDGNHDFTDNVYVDIDNDNSTFNSSSANFINPEPNLECLFLKKVFLYWAAADKEQDNGDDNQPDWNYNDLKLMLPGQNTYTTITADDIIYRGRDTHFSIDPYVCVKDITNDVLGLVTPYGKYQIANVETKTGSLFDHINNANTGTSGGWQIVFVYESPTLPVKNISLFDGYAHVTRTVNDFDINFSGFQTIPIGAVNARIVIGSLEGDRDLIGDKLQIKDVSNNFVDITAPHRNSNNFFNSRITVGNTEYTDRNPSSTNTLGFDAAVFQLDNNNNSIITNNQTSATLRLTSNQETYGLFLVGLSIDVWEPDLSPLPLTVSSGSNPSNPGDIIGFNFDVLNSGNDDAVNISLSSTLPPQVTFNGLITTQNGITYSYDIITNELVFYIENGLANVGSPSLNIDFDLKINDECYFLEDICDLSFGIQFVATYNGVENPNEQSTTSSSDVTFCNPIPYVININQPIVNWASAIGALDRTMDCADTEAFNAAQNLIPETDKCVFTLNKTYGAFIQNPDCPSAGTYTNTWSFTDACGVTIKEFVQTILITDEIPPTASNPTPNYVQCIADIPPIDIEIITDEADNCSIPTVIFINEVSDNNSCPETITRTYRVLDDCNNYIEVSHSIIINDDILPTASNPETTYIYSYDNLEPPNPEVVIDEADNCSVPTVAFVSETSNNSICPETITRIYSVTDDCDNSIYVTHIIIIEDDELPTASNPTPLVLQCIEDLPEPDVNVVTDAADDSSMPTVAFVSETSNNSTCPEIITRLYSVTDDCGNYIEVSHDIIIKDETPPTASNPATIYAQCMEEIPAPDINVVIDEFDNCSIPTVTYISEFSVNEDCMEIISRIYAITDDCGNSIEVIQDIYIEDTSAPILVTEIEESIILNCQEIPEIPLLEFIDNCSNDISIAFEEEEIELNEGNYEIIRTWLATDQCGNTVSTIQTLHVFTENESSTEVISVCIDEESIDLSTFGSHPDGYWESDSLDVLNEMVFNPETVPIGEYMFRYTLNSNQCSIYKEIIISVNDDCIDYKCIQSIFDVNISKLVTPNGDLKNETMKVAYTINPNVGKNGACDIKTAIKMFNRWGSKVFESDDYLNDWNGRSPANSIGKSDKLPSGTYYYVVNLINSGLKPIQGYILLGTEQ